MSSDAVRKITPLHDASGRFAKGNAGRPVGAKARASRDLLQQVKAMGPSAITKLWQALEANERWAVETILRHCLPPSRTVEFEDLTTEDLRAAIMAGDVSADEANRLTGAIAKLAEIENMDVIRERLDELEKLVRNANL